MPLVVFCGHPLSGKSSLCERLSEKLSKEGRTLSQISVEKSLLIDKNTAYKDRDSQKRTRSSLRSAIEREISNRSLVVLVDYFNNIKGFRYELWCIARELGTNYCVIHVDASEDTCRRRNSESGYPYHPEILEDLLVSFERPDSRNRWDTPLFTVSTDKEDRSEEILDLAAAAICGRSEIVSTTLKPTDATINPRLAATNLQHCIDKAATEIVSSLIELQSEVGSEALGTVTISETLPVLHLDRPVTATEIRRLKRGFLKLATQLLNSRITTAESASRVFIEYLQQNLDN